MNIRKSKNAGRRAIVLLAVHALIAAHITHYLVASRTVSPVEPSEAMYTLELGEVNAGFVFLLVALVATLVFGRLFCGWGCHLVALQDLCGFLMKKIGIRPRPFRSRFLAWTPAVLAFYMFAWPTLRRLVLEGGSLPAFTNHFMTSDFWKTFPGPVFAVLTFVSCGFAVVYLLGAKGFCTYGCPYGSLFAAVDRFSPARIVVDDSCRQCGHCTATCTSNVIVHEEVRRHGKVVDPGCMKCMDCVSVCPNNALSYSMAKPSLFARPAKTYSLPLGEELFVALVCAASILVFRGLYDGPPLLMSAGLGGITAFLALKTWHLVRRPTVRVQNLPLKLAGSVSRAGVGFVVVATLWLAFTAHSGYAQWHRAWGAYHLNRTEAPRAEVLTGAFRERVYSAGHHRAREKAFAHFSRADRAGLFGVPEVKLGLAWYHLLHDDVDAAVENVRSAIALRPGEPRQHENLIELFAGRGRLTEAIEAARVKIESVDPNAEDHFRIAGFLTEAGRPDEAVEHYRSCLALAPDSGAARYNLGGLLRRLGRIDEAIAELREAEARLPGDADTLVELGLALEAAGDREAAIDALRRAVRANPDSPESRLYLVPLIERLEGQGHGPEASRGSLSDDVPRGPSPPEVSPETR